MELIKSIVRINSKNLYTEYHKNHENSPTIIFLHDSLGSVELWRDFPKKIFDATKCNVLLYDRQGHGKSQSLKSSYRSNDYMEIEADIFKKLLDHFKINEAILYGYSDGGTIALITASKYPKKVKGIICEAAHIFVEEHTVKGVNEAIENYVPNNLQVRLEKYHGNKADTLFRAWTETWTRNSYRIWNIEHLLHNITCPLLFVQGENDEFGTLLQVDKTIEQVSGKTDKFIIPNIGHRPHKDATEEVLSKTITFINQLNNEN